MLLLYEFYNYSSKFFSVLLRNGPSVLLLKWFAQSFKEDNESTIKLHCLH